MKKSLHFTLILSLTFLFSCSAIINNINKSHYSPSKTVEISNYEEITLNDNYSEISVGGNVNLGFNNPINFDFGIGAKVEHYNSKFGNTSLDFNLPIYFNNSVLPNRFPSTNTAPYYEFNFAYSYPVYKKLGHKERYLSAYDENDNDYCIVTTTAVINKLNLRVGVETNFSRMFLSGYKSVLIDHNLTDIDFTDNLKDLAEINQNNTILKFGFSLQNMLKTKLDAEGKKGKKFRSFTSIVSNIYFDINYLLSSSVSSVEYSYWATPENELLEQQLYSNDLVDPTTYLNKFSTGFSIGYESNYSTIRNTKIANVSGFEFGITPGHYTKLSNGLYFKMVYKIGLGFWH